MESWREELYANELYHYGVKGMKWHHRKSPILYTDGHPQNSVTPGTTGVVSASRTSSALKDRRIKRGKSGIARLFYRAEYRKHSRGYSRTIEAGQRRFTRFMGTKTFNFLDRKRQEVGRKAYDGA